MNYDSFCTTITQGLSTQQFQHFTFVPVQAFPGLIPHQYHETQQQVPVVQIFKMFHFIILLLHQLAQQFARHAGSANTTGFEASETCCFLQFIVMASSSHNTQ